MLLEYACVCVFRDVLKLCKLYTAIDAIYPIEINWMNSQSEFETKLSSRSFSYHQLYCFAKQEYFRWSTKYSFQIFSPQSLGKAQK